MTERRRSNRITCRIGCQLVRGQDAIRARVLDVSDGGLRVLSPVEFAEYESLRIEIDLPGRQPALIDARVRHVCAVESRGTRRRAWSIGMELVGGDELREALAQSVRTDTGVMDEPAVNRESNAPDTFRVRVKLRGEPRSRLLTLSATSEEEARELAMSSLGDAWAVTEVHPAPSLRRR